MCKCAYLRVDVCMCKHMPSEAGRGVRASGAGTGDCEPPEDLETKQVPR